MQDINIRMKHKKLMQWTEFKSALSSKRRRKINWNDLRNYDTKVKYDLDRTNILRLLYEKHVAKRTCDDCTNAVLWCKKNIGFLT